MSSTNPAPEAETEAPLVGVLGAGQLGRMLALAGVPLGLRFLFVDPAPDPPAACLGEHLPLDYASPAALDRLARCAVVTYEFENVPVAPVRALAERVLVYPPVDALAVAQDRWHEKNCFQELGIPTPAFFNVESHEELIQGLTAVGYPAVLKTRRMGYDGRGQAVLRNDADAERAYAELGSVPLLLEGFVAFERELSLIGARDRNGVTRFYPLVENHHQGGILRLTLAPAPDISPERQRTAEAYMTALFDRTGYVGVLALELFQAGGRLVANEIAPRVHNSGHLTIEGARTSQFEQHLRAILGLPLGSPELPGPSAMLNCIGRLPEAARVLAVPDAHLHAYGKLPRSGRKVGHVTVRAPDFTALAERLSQLVPMIESPP
ncbi:MAG TPA: 5-(carboxyamino)imidazole ribonucleotide synthase [Polyangiaceae bacterium]|nr:5-(carboxyamino)imidazole ribonucleotide synthase [Polyangiaceae bacterium]